MAKKLSAEQLASWRTANLYQFIHGLGLLVVGLATLLVSHRHRAVLDTGGWFIFLGTLLFCASVYIKAGKNCNRIVALIPVGGVMLALGWILLAFGIWQH